MCSQPRASHRRDKHLGGWTAWRPELRTRSGFPCGSDPQRHIQALQEYAGAVFDKVYVQQIGPQQEPFFDFFASTCCPR